MTFEELNIVRTLKKQIAAENKKLKALKIVIGAYPHKYGKSNESGVASGGLAKSDFENLAVQIVDAETQLEKFKTQLTEAVPRLTKQIQEEIKDDDGQALLIYRYVACEYFRNIGFLMGYSENWVYWKHNQILKKFGVV